MKLSDWLFAPGGKGVLLDDGAIFFFELWHEVMIEKATDLVFCVFIIILITRQVCPPTKDV